MIVIYPGIMMNLKALSHISQKGRRTYKLNFTELAFEISSNIREHQKDMLPIMKKRLLDIFKEMGMKNMSILAEGESLLVIDIPGSNAMKEFEWVYNLTLKTWRDLDEFDAWVKQEKERLTRIYNMNMTLRHSRIQEIVNAAGILGLIPFIMYVGYLTFDRKDYTGPIIIMLLVMFLGVLVQQFEMARRGAAEMERRIKEES